MNWTKVASRTALLAIATAFPVAAHAGGFMVARFGGEHGNPMASNATSIYYNPAGLAGIDGWQLYLEGEFAFRKLTYDRSTTAIDGTGHSADYIDANSGEGGLTNILASPFLGVATDFGIEGLGVGVAFYVPFGGQAKFDKDDAFEGNTMFPGAVDGTQRFQDIEGSLRALYVSAGAAYRFKFGLSVGVTLSAVRNEINDIKAFNADGTDTLQTSSGAVAEGRAWVNSSSTDLAVGVGLQYTPPSLPELTIGVSYQSQPGFGTITEKGEGKIKLGTAPELTPNVNVEQALPDVIRAGLAYRVTPTLELRVFGAFERWSAFKSQCFYNPDLPDSNCALDDRGQTTSEATVISNIPRRWKDMFGVRAGASYWVSPKLELMLGTGYDGNAVPDDTLLVDLPDFNNIEINLGVQYAVLDSLRLYVGLSQFIYFSRTVENGNRTNYVPPSRQADNSGEYSESISLLQVGLNFKF